MASPTTELSPDRICGYRVSGVAGHGEEGTSYFAAGAGGRAVVLKPLDPDCILGKSGLHPSVRERLARVRELALAGVANLHGIERDAAGADRAWLIWEHVPGRSFEDVAAEPGLSSPEFARLARDVVTVVGALHVQGVVHGALSGGNVIVTPAGAVRLTHVSPLLYTDPAEDARSAVDLLHAMASRRGESDAPAGRALADAMADAWADVPASLRQLAARLSAASSTASAAAESDEPGHAVARGTVDRASDVRPRRRAVAGAVGAVAFGAAAAYGIWLAVGRTTTAPPPSSFVPRAWDARAGK